ncbi:MAG: alpha/beta fold hydrolase [Pseudomonadota bacterium]
MFFSHIIRSSIIVFGLFCAACVQTQIPTNAPDERHCEDAADAAVLADSHCHAVTVPLSYDERDGEQISLFVRTFPALKERRGAVLLLAGGPGESGASFYADIAFFRDVFEHYELIIPDHRGTGYSSKLCEPEETPASEGGLNLVGEEWGTCFGQLYAAIDRTHAFNLENAAQDIATIIESLKLGDETYVYGVSYGTSLALAVAERTQANLTGIILDSLTPLPSDDQESLGYRSQITDQIGQQVLERCAAEPSCPLGSDAVQVYTNLLKRIDAGETIAGLDAVPNRDLRQLLGQLLDVPSARGQIPSIIAAMVAGDDTAEARIGLAIETFETFLAPIVAFNQATASIPLTSLMSGSEFNTRKNLTSEQVAAEKTDLLFTSPLPNYLAIGQFPLYEPSILESPRTDLPPLLVLHGTLDPKTTYEGALRRVEVLRGLTDVHVVTLVDAPHAAYLTSQDCLRTPLRAFIADDEVLQTTDCQSESVSLKWE